MKKKICLIVALSIIVAVFPIMSSSAGSVFAGGDGTEANPYLISTQEQLEIVSDLPTEHFKLIDDIEIRGKLTPLCSLGDPFTGVFDGNNYTIRNLDLEDSENDECGLFSQCKGTIKNLNVEVCDSGIQSSNTHIGGLIGFCSNAVIDNCHISGNITGTNATQIGGLIGKSYKSNITNSSAIVKLTQERTYASLGGFMGYSTGDTIDGCYANADVSHIKNEKYSYAVYAGFLAQSSGSSISNSYSKGKYYIDIHPSDSYWSQTKIYVGGFIGNSSSSNKLINCYSTSSVTARDAAEKKYGGMIGTGTVDITSCYYDKSLSGCSDTGKGVPKTSLGMKLQAIYTDWDFDTVWGMSEEINDGYPYLRWQYPDVDTTKLNITEAVSAEHQLGFIAESNLSGSDTKSFGIEFVPEKLYNTDANRVRAAYDASKFELSDGSTFSAVLTNIPSGWEEVQFAGRAFAEKTSGEYIWSLPKSASINNTTLQDVQ